MFLRWPFFAKTTGTSKQLAAAQAIGIPDASTVRIFVMFSFRLIYSKRVIKWWIVSVIFFYISFNGLPLISSNYIVETVSPYRVSLRQGLNTIDIIGEHD